MYFLGFRIYDFHGFLKQNRKPRNFKLTSNSCTFLLHHDPSFSVTSFRISNRYRNRNWHQKNWDHGVAGKYSCLHFLDNRAFTFFLGCPFWFSLEIYSTFQHRTWQILLLTGRKFQNLSVVIISLFITKEISNKIHF